MKARGHGPARTACVGALVALVAALGTPFAGVAHAATTLTVQVGGSSSDGSVDGQSFYPGTVTIHQGDAIAWRFRGAHTVNFYTPPGDPEAPGVGDGTFNGVDDPESSGIKFPAPGGDTYTLTFGAAGNFLYFCALHPGMQGLVQVVAADSATPVTTQAEADSAGAAQLAADLAAGKAAVDAYQPGSTTANGKTTWDVANGISEAPTATAALSPVTAGGPQGTATLTVQGTTLHVAATLSGLAPGAHPAHIHSGQCGISSPPKGAANDILFPLPDAVADSSGNATISADVTLPAPPVIPSNSWYLNVHTSASDLTPVACGNVLAHPASSLRFHPGALTIKAGDTVRWTMMDAHEVHPLYIGPQDKAPANPFSPPSGGTTVSSTTQQVLSGPQLPGSVFAATFTAPGTYTYLCTLHASLGMRGTVTVLASSTSAPPTAAPRAGGTLARTGLSLRAPLAIAAVLLVVGAVVLATQPRRRAG